ncbi:MAG: S41 family peptidase [Candidatus Brocadiia bacterium]
MKSWLQTILLCTSIIIAGLLIRQYLLLYTLRADLGEFQVQQALDDIERYHIRKLTNDEKIQSILAGLTSALGPYARYYSPEDLVDRMESLEGSFVGIGINFKVISGHITIVYPIPGTAAEKGGLKTGDKLLEADGKTLVNLKAEDARKLLTGPINSVIKLKIERPGEQSPREVTLIRTSVPSSSVRYVHVLPDGKTGFIYVADFSRETAPQLEHAIATLRSSGATRLILDIRHNGGGLMDAGVDVADLFIEKGVIVTVKSGNQEDPYQTDIFRAKKEGTIGDLPIALLVDNGSASSSEIFAAAMKYHKRAVLVGEKTYGKGTVQQIFQRGLGGWGLKFTVAMFYSPDGMRIDGNGIEPTFRVAQSEETFLLNALRFDVEEVRRYLPDYTPIEGRSKFTLEHILGMKDAAVDAALLALDGQPVTETPLPSPTPAPSPSGSGDSAE